MTAGALVALQAGVVDRMAFLTLNPQITHFKAVYKKYTNFATQFITELPIGDTILQWNTDKTVQFQIPRNGDAMRDIYFTCELPDIYSNSQYQFQWINRIGEYLVKSVAIQMDTATIDTHYAEWFHAYSELNLEAGRKEKYYKMIGNVPELYDPANAAGNNGVYPASTIFPSIVNNKLYLPLAFWFNKFSSMCFPLIAIQKTNVYITFTLRRLCELYTVINAGNSNVRIRPYTTNHYIGNFLSPKTSAQTLDINAKLEVNYMFLDNEERKRFALQSHDYLINQLQLITNTVTSSATVQIDLKNINKPVTELVFMIRRTDLENVNQWSNFTNWNIPDIPPYSVGYMNINGPPLTISTNNLLYYKTKNLLKAATLRLMTQEITSGYVRNNDTLGYIDGKDSVFYNLMQNYNSNKNMPDEGIYTYSFSFDNASLQPIGSVNMSTITNKDILMNLTALAPSGYTDNVTPYSYNIYVFAVNYDILKILGGMVATMTAN
jgi:hypothetical protein